MAMRIIAPLFIVFIMLIAGVNAQVTIDSPLNITYNTTNVDLNVSAPLETVVGWFYNLDDNQTDNITFTPNTTLENMTFGTHRLEVFVNGSNETGSIYGNGTYGSGLYGFADTTPQVISATVWFTINQVLRWHIQNPTGALIVISVICFIVLIAGLAIRW
jgi:hypothetical protein